MRAALLILGLLAQAVPPAQDARISVFVTAPMRDGFVDTSKPIEDSIKDIRGEMKGMKELRLVDDPAHADLILVIAARGVGSESFGTRTNINDKLYTGTDITTTEMVANTYWLSTVMQAGSYRKEFLGQWTNTAGTSMGAWRINAETVAKNVRAWATTNAAKLRSKRGTF
jgi:hypothetical protein